MTGQLLQGVRSPVSKVRESLRDPLIVNSSLILTTTVLMALAGSIFWVVAARLATSEQVGLASSLVSTTEALAVFAQLGLNITLIRTMPKSDRQASDVVLSTLVVGAAGAVLALGYGLALPTISPAVADVVTHPGAITLFAVLVAATAVNQLTDGIFLSINHVIGNLWVNGVLMGLVKLALPFLLVGAGALGVYASVGGSALVAALASLVLILRALPGRATRRPSKALLSSSRFSTAGYVSSVLYFVPQLVFPVLIINAEGPERSAVYFIGFQIATLLNAGIYAIANAMYAEASRRPEQARQVVAKGGRTIMASVFIGVVALWAATPVLLSVFGEHYADQGVTTLRILALGALGVGINYWGAVRLRLANHHGAMVGVQLFTTILMVVLAALAAPHGIEWVAVAWGAGQLVGGLVGALAVHTIAPLHDETPNDEPYEVADGSPRHREEKA